MVYTVGGAQKQYVFQTAFPFMLHVVHTFPQMHSPPTHHTTPHPSPHLLYIFALLS